MKKSIHRCAVLLVLIAITLAVPSPAAADTFTVRDDKGQEQTFEARLHGSDADVLLLERPTGRIEIVPNQRIVSREPGDDPTPVTGEEMLDELQKRFGGDDGDRFIGSVSEPFVVGIALQAPLEKRARGRALALLKKATTFLHSLQRSFDKFATRMDLPHEEPRYPLVMVIFETDAMFEDYATQITGGRGLSATNITGFYSGLTNWLAVRLDECDDFQLPLHEGIHQQVYNRGWFQRLATIPVWFDEGIATGFEADGADVKTDPRQLNGKYALMALGSENVSFDTILRDDRPFRGDVLAGEAYMRAWALHWLLVGSRPKQYAEYVRQLGAREPLGQIAGERRISQFESTFDVSVAELNREFATNLVREARLQKVRPPRGPKPGYVYRQDQMGTVELQVVGDGSGRVRAAGEIKNSSPLRPLVFNVRLVPAEGQMIEWTTPAIQPNRRHRLPLRQMLTREAAFRTQIRSALPESAEARQWAAREQATGGR